MLGHGKGHDDDDEGVVYIRAVNDALYSYKNI